MRKLLLLSTIALSSCFTLLKAQTTVTISPSQDNTIFETPVGNSNGSGDHLFSGLTAGSSIRRALLEFDIAANVPAGATITGVSLDLTVDQSVSGALPMTLNTISSNWGEGASAAVGPGGNGAAAQLNDATWLNSFFPSTLWTTAGGDFNSTASASANVAGNGLYTWTSAQLAADVQSWLDAPAGNNGWMLIGDESTTQSAKRFCSRENTTASNRPALSITYTMPCVQPDVPTLTADNMTICDNGTSTITAGGNLNDATSWNLYEVSCGGTLVESNTTGIFAVSPGSTTTYYVIGEGGCSSAATCSTITINVLPTTTGSQTLTVCAGGSVTVGGNTYTTSGTYTDVLAAANGCDSTVTTNLTVSPVITGSQTLTVCAGGSVTVGGNTYTTSGTFTDILTAANGCDSTVTTNLTVSPAITGSQTLTVCAGGMVMVGTSMYMTSGTFTDVLTAANGCDSTVTTNLTVSPAITGSQTLTVCAGGMVMVGSSMYMTSGTFTDVLTAANGCDSTVTTNLTVSPAITGSQTLTVCAGGSVTVGGTTHSTSGTFTDILTAANGCDSTVTTNLTVSLAITGSQTLTVCAGGSVTVGGTTHTTAGTFTDVLTAANGCDSTVTTNLTVSPAITGSQTLTVCAGGSVTVGGTTHTTTGTFTDVLTAANGCDSTVTTNLTVSPAITGSQTISLCSGGSVTVGTTTHNTSGTYVDVISAMNGCDSTVTTVLIINTTITTSQTLTVCSGGSVTVGSNTYSTSGVYTDTFTAIGGCDSTVTTNLTVSPAITSSQTLTVCAGGSVTVGGTTHTTSGTFTDILTAANGCDSTVTTNLTVSPAITGSQTLTVCAGGSVTIGGTTHTTSGTFTDILTAANGCDSTVTTNLTVSPAITGSQTLTVCAGGSVSVGGTTHTTTGTFTDILTAANGCDSTVTTNLIVSPAITGSQTLTVCSGGSVTLGGTTHTTSGTFTDVLTAANGCDSTVITNLTVSPAITGSQTLTVCAGGSVTVGGTAHTTTGTFTDVLTAANGCDSTVTTNLTVSPAITGSQTLTVCAGGMVMVGTSMYMTSGTFTDVLTAANGCDSTVTTNLTVDPAITSSQSFTVCAGGMIMVGTSMYMTSGTFTDVFTAANGCDSTVTTSLTVRPVNATTQVFNMCSGGSVTVGANTYTTTGVYTDILTDMNSCDSTVTTDLTIASSIVINNITTICAGDSVVLGTHTYNTTGVYSDTFTAMAGCDSIVNTDLTVSPAITGTQTLTVCAGGMVMVGASMYMTSGTYTDIFTAMNGCDSTLTTNLTVLSADTTIQMVTVCAGDTLMIGTSTYFNSGIYTNVLTSINGCDSTLITNLTVNPAITGSQTLTVCAGGMVMVGTSMYMTSGTFTDILTAVDGCDSTVTTNLTVMPAITGSQVLNMCSGSTVTVGASTYNTTGIYTDVLMAANGCDSTVTTDLTISNSITTSQAFTVCFGGSITVGTNTYNASGVYTDLFTAVGGCDSTITTTLTVSPMITGAQTITLCDGGSVTVGTNTYNASGVYTDMFTAMNGCDSTLTTTVIINAPITGLQTSIICAGDSLIVGGMTYYTTGIYTNVLTSFSGCDSTLTTDLTVMPAIAGTQSMTICAGDSITVGTSTYSTSGSYSDVFTAMNGCDSTLTTNLTVMPAITTTHIITVCAGGSVTVDANTYNATSIYLDVYTAANGCDSTLITDLTVSPAITVSQTFMMCTGSSVTVGTNTYNTSGVYLDVFTAANGCDSTLTTNLTITDSIVVNQSMTICYGNSITVGANTYDTTGVYTDILTAIGGCDSTVVTALTVMAPIVASQNVTLCGGDTLFIAGNTYTTSGVYTDALTSVTGCDSTLTTNLTVMPVIATNQSITVCAGGSITVGGFIHFTSGTFTDVLTAMSGCDSTVTTNLTVSPAITSSQTFLMCSGSMVMVGTNMYDTTGVYTDVFTSMSGCDSTVTTNLTITDSIVVNQTFTLCAGGSITIQGNIYDTTGIYVNMFTAIGGCDSTVVTNLIINPAVIGSQTMAICAGDSLMVGTNTYNATGTYTDIFTAMNGCDSTVTTMLTVLPAITDTIVQSFCQGGSIIVGSNTYTASGTYIDVLIAMNGCDSTVITQLTVLPLPTVALAAFPSHLCTQAGVIVLTQGSPSGGIYSDSGNGIVASPNINLTAAGVGVDTITYTVTGVNGCVNSASRPMNIVNCTGVEEFSFTNDVNVYPNPNNGMFNISITNANFNNLTISINDVEGREVYASQDKIGGTEFSKQINLDELAKGVYYIKLSNGTETNIKKLVIQ